MAYEIIAAFFVITLHGGFFYLNLQQLLYTDIQFHNPIRYANVIRELIPHAAEKNILFGENIIEVQKED